MHQPGFFLILGTAPSLFHTRREVVLGPGTGQEGELWPTASPPLPQPLDPSQLQTETRANPGGPDRDKFRAARYSGAPGAWDLGWAAANDTAASASSQTWSCTLPAPEEGQRLSSAASPVALVPAQDTAMDWTELHRGVPASSSPFAQQRLFSSANTRESAAPKKWCDAFWRLTENRD